MMRPAGSVTETGTETRLELTLMTLGDRMASARGPSTAAGCERRPKGAASRQNSPQTAADTRGTDLPVCRSLWAMSILGRSAG